MTYESYYKKEISRVLNLISKIFFQVLINVLLVYKEFQEGFNFNDLNVMCNYQEKNYVFSFE